MTQPRRNSTTSGGLSYNSAGVDTHLETTALGMVTRRLRSTWERRGNVLLEFGHFANVVQLGPIGIAISTDGVGSKVLIAQLMEKYDSIGIDCIAMNVNDVLCVGAEPESLVDYIAVEHLQSWMLDEISKGLQQGAEQSNITVVGGEVSQVKAIIRGEETDLGFDLAGTCIGTVDPEMLITGSRIEPGDVILGLRSAGVHSNGLTLARRVFGLGDNISHREKQSILSAYSPDLGSPLGEELLKPTRIYVAGVMGLLTSGIDVRGLAHITTGGFLNLLRLYANVEYVIDNLPEPHPIFKMIQRQGKIETREMCEVFNMGVGFCIVVADRDYQRALDILQAHGVDAQRIGSVSASPSRSVNMVPQGLRGTKEHGFLPTT